MGWEEVKALDMNKTQQIHKNEVIKICCTRVWVVADLKCLPHKFEDLRTPV